MPPKASEHTSLAFRAKDNSGEEKRDDPGDERKGSSDSKQACPRCGRFHEDECDRCPSCGRRHLPAPCSAVCQRCGQPGHWIQQCTMPEQQTIVPQVTVDPLTGQLGFTGPNAVQAAVAASLLIQQRPLPPVPVAAPVPPTSTGAGNTAGKAEKGRRKRKMTPAQRKKANGRRKAQREAKKLKKGVKNGKSEGGPRVKDEDEEEIEEDSSMDEDAGTDNQKDDKPDKGGMGGSQTIVVAAAA